MKALVSLLKVIHFLNISFCFFYQKKWNFSIYWKWYTHADELILSTVKIIMDKISKRSKGYAFIEYTTEEAAAAALKEMNGKVSFTCLIVLYKIIRINQTPSRSVVFIFVYMFLKQIRHSEKQILRYFC